jgi:signal transduction histidine kinase/ActR/RegA family two-component response regulator
MSTKIMTAAIAAEDDVVRARQLARMIAGGLGYAGQDQTRIATAVSEVARNAFMYAGGGTVRFGIDSNVSPALLEIIVEDRGPGIAALQAVLDGSYVSQTGMGLGLRGARRLMDDCTIDSNPGAGTRIVMRKLLPKRTATPTPQTIATLTQRLAAEMPRGPLSEMREQNRELIESLDELRERQDELAQLNNELADTNRGVVALYAELDDKAEHLRRASDMKTRFLSNMTHELRTPINSILALARMLQDRVDGDLTPEQARQVGFIRQSAEGLSEIINDLLDLAKVEAGRIEVRATDFTAVELLGALRGMFRPLLREGVSLIIEEPETDIELRTDQGKVAQILRNFISNALKFTEHGQVIVSTAVAEGGFVAFSVRDTGIGIAPEHLSYIFEEFTQLDSPLQAKAKGTGLGLPLSNRLAELLGGRVAVTSDLGSGSLFSLTIPRVLAGARSPADDGVAAKAPAGTARRVLIVDDDAAARYVASQIARQLGGEVSEATNGLEALALAYRDRPQLILVDLRMPGMDGFQLLQHLRGDPRTSATPVVVVTSSLVTTAERSRLRGADAILSKAEFSADALAPWLAPRAQPELQTQGG